jgi:hypothetical protein
LSDPEARGRLALRTIDASAYDACHSSFANAAVDP